MAYNVFLTLCCIICQLSVTFGQKDCSPHIPNYIPLTDFDSKTLFRGFKGGLYGDGNNIRTGMHKIKAMEYAALVTPLNTAGKYDATGKIGFLAVGASNPRTEFNAFIKYAQADKNLNPALVFVNSCIGGQGIQKMKEKEDNYWKSALKLLDSQKISNLQIEVVWIETDNTSNGDTSFPAAPLALSLEYAELLQTIYYYFPSVKICYLGARTFSGFAIATPGGVGKGLLFPKDYYHGWANRFVVDQVINRQNGFIYEGVNKQIPFTTWGNYSWTNGSQIRKDNFKLDCTQDFGLDGLHLTAAGEDKVGALMYQYFSTDESSIQWFYKNLTSSIQYDQVRIPSLLQTVYPSSNVDLKIQESQGCVRLRITDLTGRVYIQSINPHSEIITPPRLAPGIHFLSFYSTERGWTSSQKFIVW